MKKTLLSLIFIMIMLTTLKAQDEGTAVAQERFERDKSIYITGGPSFTFGENIGDYSTGINMEIGFNKKLNKVLSLGGSVSYLKFKYDPTLTQAENADDLYVGSSTGIYAVPFEDGVSINDKYALSEDWDFGYLLNLEGGDLSLISLAFNIKINFIPVGDNTKFSVYGFAKPFISFAKRNEVSGIGERYLYEAYEDDNGTYFDPFDDFLYFNLGDDTWYADGYYDEWGADGFPVLAEETSITGGIFLGPGLEFMPSGKISAFVQAGIGYTFPVSYVSTESYDKDFDDYLNEEFPMVKEGFPSLNVQVGISYNFK